MANPVKFNAVSAINKTHALEDEIRSRQVEVDSLIFQLEQMKKDNARNIKIMLQEAILNCLDVDEKDSDFGMSFLRTPVFISDCVAWSHGMNADRNLKNKIASTLSTMFSKKEVGRYEHPNGKTYYGLPRFFVNADKLITVKPKYLNKLSQLAA